MRREVRTAISMNLSPETGLMICCARTKVPADLAGQIRSLAAGTLDWDRLISAAEQNSVTALLERHLRVFVPDLVPPAQMNRLATINKEGAFRCLKLTGELLKIVTALEAQAVVPLPYKGPVLAAQAFGEIGLRNFDDVDILVPQRDIGKAHGTMLELGYRPSLAWMASPEARRSVVPGEYKYYRKDCDAIVEFHTERTLRHFPVIPNLYDFARRGVRITLSGHEILTLCAEDALVALCIHGTKDFWGRLLWIADVAETIQSQSLDLNVVFERAESLRAERMLRLGLILAERILRAPIPPECSRKARDDAVACSLAVQMEQQLLVRNGEPLNGPASFAFRRRSVPGFVAGWRYAMRLATAPAQDDMQMVQLPRGFQALYTLLRPLRLLFKYRENE
jgi:putative nucleotidyltransferase-like protein